MNKKELTMNNEEKILNLLTQMNIRMDEMTGRMDQMQDDITSIKLRLELDVEKRFNAVNDSIDAISKKLDTLDEVKELAEGTADKVDAICAAVTQHSAAITELKKVQ